MAESTTSMRGGGIRIFRLWGIDVSLHWMWLLVAVFEIQQRRERYTSIAWNIAEYLALFLIVLMHEFGHALACRSVGGEANHIMLWPLGGVAFVKPPARPGAVLWSIVAGPLVNVLLLPVTIGAYVMVPAAGNLEHFLKTVMIMNIVLLVFNILPIYPLDGGKIVWALLWFVIGQARALMIASVIGIVGTLGGIALLLVFLGPQSLNIWLLLIAAFAVMQSLSGLKQAKALSQALSLPRNTSCVCPSCRQSPPVGVGWRCRECGQVFDLFGAWAACPQCGLRVDPVPCPLCGLARPWNEWTGHAVMSPPGFQRIPATASPAPAPGSPPSRA